MNKCSTNIEQGAVYNELYKIACQSVEIDGTIDKDYFIEIMKDYFEVKFRDINSILEEKDGDNCTMPPVRNGEG